MSTPVHIYALINPINNNVFYIGASISPRHRLSTHIAESRFDKNYKSEQIREILANGLKVDYEVLETCEADKARFWEEFYMDLFCSFGFTLRQNRDSYYNFRGDSDNSRSIQVKLSESTRLALRIISEKTDCPQKVLIHKAIKNYIKKIIKNDKALFKDIKYELFDYFEIDTPEKEEEFHPNAYYVGF